MTERYTIKYHPYTLEPVNQKGPGGLTKVIKTGPDGSFNPRDLGIDFSLSEETKRALDKIRYSGARALRARGIMVFD